MPAPLYGSPSPYPDSPAAFSPLTISNSDRKTEDRTLSTDIKTYSAPLFESRDFSLFQKQKSDKLSVAVDKVLSLFLFVEFEFTCDMGLENDPKILGSSVNRNRIRRAAEEILLSVPQNKVKQKNPGYRLKTGFSMETHVPLEQLH